ncbi:hypothetical protein JTI77_18165 [Vibrio furnissii]|nr:hypothetical protein JV197_17960 [Vibrio furnissii]QTG90811.1 hypothetical protein JTI73_18155 [Vibrio furnissii]QTG97570.1 hypothetical protein JTI77_18165 [Vibrio furnissii]
MPEAYCNCCRKTTPHKVVMRRSQAEPTTGWQGFQQFMAALMHGEHYYKMEKQGFCRVCNQQSDLSPADFSRARVI